MSQKNEVSIFWFRRDLRIADNCALFHALKSGYAVQCVFIFDKNILNQLEDKNDRRIVFIHRQLHQLNNELKLYGASLLTYFDYPAEALKKICDQFHVKYVFANHDYEPEAIKRDEEVKNLLMAQGIPFNTYKDQVVLEKKEVTKEDGMPYTVFTPYKNKYLQILNHSHLLPYNTLALVNNFYKNNNTGIHSIEAIGFNSMDITFPENTVDESLILNYHHTRDYPAKHGTSALSIHLRFGTISIRALMKQAFKLNGIYANELIWREFYMMILFHFPHAVNEGLKRGYNYIKWRNNEEEFTRWCTGQTGYPIVDAGMRELNQTGFMHNRLRMITASFLVKHLLIDWRWGEAYFAKKLNDFELSSNNGGWQWASGSGCDAAPYFRIFNPYEQTRKFDKEKLYINKWVPELNDLSYPQPVVEHNYARKRCLEVYKKALTQ